MKTIKFEYDGMKFKSVKRKDADVPCSGCYFLHVDSVNCKNVPNACVENSNMIYIEDEPKPKRYKVKTKIEYVEPMLLYSIDAVNNIVEEILKRSNAFQIF